MLGVRLQLLRPHCAVQRGHTGKLRLAKRQALPLQIAIARGDAKGGFLALGLALQALQQPVQHAHVFAVAGPDELAVRPFAKPVHAVNARQGGTLGLQFFAQLQPVPKVVAHVVAAKRQHGKRVAAHHALLAKGGGGGFAAHGGGHVHAFDPVARFGDQRHGAGAAAAEDEGINLHALGVVPGRVEHRVVRRRHGKTGVGVGGLGPGFLGDGRGPMPALPVDQMRRQLAAVVGLQPFPPHVAIVGQRHVGEDHVAVQAGHAVGVGLQVGARCHAEVTGLGVDGPQAAVGLRLNPGDVVAHGGHAPARKPCRRHQHGKVGLAAGAGEGRCNVVLHPFGAGHAQNQHVLGQPALVLPHLGSDAQRQALFAQQGVAAVARAIAPDFARFREVDDVFRRRVAGPGGGIGGTLGQRCAHGVHAGHESAIGPQHIPHFAAHARHQPHVHGHVGAIA